MKTEIELARARRQRTGQLAVGARIARERYQFYKAQVYGPQTASITRLRQLKRSAEIAERRLQAAQSPRPSALAAGRTSPGGSAAA